MGRRTYMARILFTSPLRLERSGGYLPPTSPYTVIEPPYDRGQYPCPGEGPLIAINSSPLRTNTLLHVSTIKGLFSTNSILPCSHNHIPPFLWRHQPYHIHHSVLHLYTHFSKWQSPNNILLLDFTNIAQLNIPNSTAAPTHHVSILITHLIYSFSTKNFSKPFWALSRGPRGSRDE